MVDRRWRVQNDVVRLLLQLGDMLDQFQPRHLADVELQIRIDQRHRLGPAERALLWIEVGHENRRADGAEAAGELHGNRRLARAPLLRDDGNYPPWCRWHAAAFLLDVSMNLCITVDYASSPESGKAARAREGP
ncbi:MAG: hypothetical protein AW07_04243 [Candidatus Accumulibacter sp. SK-11]|nr:MAG: hypothetical protein AW07_04243 [Candidatus Accumulibacter sp. SK-11]